MEKDNKIVLGALVGTILVGSLLIGGGNKNTNGATNAAINGGIVGTPTTTPTAVPTVKPTPKPVNNSSAFKDGYMSGCDDGSMTEYCSCTFEYLNSKLTNDEFLEMAIEYTKTEVMPDMMLDAVTECVNLIN